MSDILNLTLVDVTTVVAAAPGLGVYASPSSLPLASAATSGMMASVVSDGVLYRFDGTNWRPLSSTNYLTTTTASVTELQSLSVTTNSYRFVDLTVSAMSSSGALVMARRVLGACTPAGVTTSTSQTAIGDWSNGISSGSLVLSLVNQTNAVSIRVQGLSATTITWTARGQIVEVRQ